MMKDIKLVIDYSGLNYNDVMQLPVDTFRLMLKNAFLDRLMSTPEGRKYLEDCERLKQTAPDMDAFRKKMNK
ncbi:MAG: hypothetical protein PHE63_00240 [Eubacteriales bacterium]|nr:hypothetical protein [Eubacteriales bacterium]